MTWLKFGSVAEERKQKQKDRASPIAKEKKTKRKETTSANIT